MNFLLQNIKNVGSLLSTSLINNNNNFSSLISTRFVTTLNRLHKLNVTPKVNKKKKGSLLDGKPFASGVVLKTLIKKPRKPNSANRKCVLLKLSTGKEMVAYVPGVGHNLQEHNTVLVKVSRVKDTPGVKLKCVRGKYDLGHPVKREQ